MELPLVAGPGRHGAGGRQDRTSRFLAEHEPRHGERRSPALTREIYALAGGEFNINSPIQLREILFDRLGLKSAKKTAKTRAASTAEEVLEELAQHHELPRKILDYRAVQKLKSTYVDALPAARQPARPAASTRRFNQTVAATGRLSVTDPNLQNIPIRTAEGRRIREAFVAEPGHLLLSRGLQPDRAARPGPPLEGPDPDRHLPPRRGRPRPHRRARSSARSPPCRADEQRRISKMVNYALLYGKTAFTLAKDIGVHAEGGGDQFIQAYFARYPAVRALHRRDDRARRARRAWCARCWAGCAACPTSTRKNFQVRMEAERQAMNTPVQGSAADLIKKAMIDLAPRAAARRAGARASSCRSTTSCCSRCRRARANEAMRAGARTSWRARLALDVPLVADARLGANWAEVH